MLRHSVQRFLNLPLSVTASTRLLSTVQPERTLDELDRLFSKVTVEVRGHEKAVLQSYTTFLLNTCEHLELERSDIRHLPAVRWLQWALKSKFVHKKNKLHYETKTYIRQIDVLNVTGSTTSTFLEYIQRNLPEGVAMKVTYNELCALPESVRKLVEKSET